MNWIKDPPTYKQCPETWRASAYPIRFIISWESDAKRWRITMCGMPKQGDYIIARVDDLEEAKRFAEWTYRAHEPIGISIYDHKTNGV